MIPTEQDRKHLREAHRDCAQGYCIHPMTGARFQALGWVKRTNGTGFLVPRSVCADGCRNSGVAGRPPGGSEMSGDLLEACLDAAMQHYPKGTTYTVRHGQTWDAAAYDARRKEITPLVQAVIQIASAKVTQRMSEG